MKSLSQLSFILVLSAGLIASDAQAKEYQFKFKVTPNSDTEKIPKVIPNEYVTVNEQQIAAFDTAFSNPLSNENDSINFKVQAVQTNADAQTLNRLVLYAMPNGSVFVPKGWQLIKGSIGANGSVSYTFAPSAGEGYLTFYDASACVGCAQSAASVFFQEAYQDAKENDFTVYNTTNLPMKNIRLNPNLVAYSVEQEGKRLDGIAYYNANADFPFWQAEVSLPAKARDLANPLLNQFISFAKDR